MNLFIVGRETQTRMWFKHAWLAGRVPVELKCEFTVWQFFFFLGSVFVSMHRWCNVVHIAIGMQYTGLIVCWIYNYCCASVHSLSSYQFGWCSQGCKGYNKCGYLLGGGGGVMTWPFPFIPLVKSLELKTPYAPMNVFATSLAGGRRSLVLHVCGLF